MPTVAVLFFAGCADAVGSPRVQVEIAAPCTAAELIVQLAAEYPQAADLLDRCAIAINECYARRSASLKHGDIVALIPPVSGG